MAFATTSLGPNSVQIAYSAENKTTMIEEIKTQLAALGGWTFLATSGDYHYFSAPQKDGPTDTYLKGLRIYLTNTVMYVAVYEKMDQVADTTTTNLYTYASNLTLELANSGDLFILCSQQHVYFLARGDNNGVQTNFCGAVETARDHGIPVGPQMPFQWMENSYVHSYGGYAYYTSIMANDGVLHNLPVYASMQNDWMSWGFINSADYVENMNSAGQAGVGEPDYATGQRMVSSLRDSYRYSNGNYPTKSRYLGRRYNLACISGQVGTIQETVDIPLDVNGWPAAGGTPKTHMIIFSAYSYTLCVPL